MEELKYKILFVDDYPIILDIACSILDDDYTVITCKHGEEAIKNVAEHNFSIIFMDLNMPGINGFEATKKIRLMPQGEKIPIIGLTGYYSEEEISECLNAGMNDILEKPFDCNSISLIIDKWLNGKNGIENDTEKEKKALTSPDNNNTTCKIPINYNKALLEFENDEQLLQSIIDKFCCVVKRQLSEFKVAVKENNIKTIKDNAHSIRGGAANLCAENLSKVAEKIENKCINNDMETIVKDIDELEEKFQLLETYVKDTLKIVLPTC
ncbi:MAG: response regulator [Chitinispirillia bacterium]|jgi:CheY-like chemotaxis protein/HPt (histidine-containing phosphotransfer) domain-containing protein